jgi:hypothetical protein
LCRSVIGCVTGEWSDTINLESVVDPGFALGLDPLTGGEIGLDREHAASSLLAEITVAGADHDRFALDGDLYPSTPALRRSRYQLLIPTVRSISPQAAVSLAMSSGQHIVSIRASKPPKERRFGHHARSTARASTSQPDATAECATVNARRKRRYRLRQTVSERQGSSGIMSRPCLLTATEQKLLQTLLRAESGTSAAS